MWKVVSMRATWLFGALLGAALSGFLAGCEDALATQQPNPVLVTLPADAQPDAETSVTPSPVPVAGTPSVPATTRPTEPVPPTPVPQSSGIGSARLLWEWGEVARPSSLAASTARLAAIIGDGRFAWLNAENGQVESSAFLWTGILQGESWGEVYVDGLGTLAVAAIREQSISTQTGLADSRARLAVYDAQATELWSLPELEAQHFYSAALTSVSVVVGKWPQGFEDNSLAAYELYTGEKLWEINDPEADDAQPGYQQILHDGNRLYVLINGSASGAVAAFDLRTGDELWHWSDLEVIRPDQIALSHTSVYVLSVNRTLALDPGNGSVQWTADLRIAPEAGVAVRGNNLYLAPSPAAELGFRPGIMSLYTDGTGLAWHSLAGLLADPVEADEEAVWTIVKDYDSGQVSLSGLAPDTGLEQVRLPVSTSPEVLYQLVAFERRVYVLGDSLLAYGY